MGTSLKTFADSSAVNCLGRGIYDIKEMARLLRQGRLRVEGWTHSRGSSPALLTPELAGLFSFWDLISARVVAELIQRGVPRSDIYRGAQHLAQTLDTDRPFAHQRLATVGIGFFADVEGDWQDAGQRGQLAFPDVIRPLLEPITFDDSQMAAIWRPHPGVWINPNVQAGAPCVDGTRVPTLLLVSLIDSDKPDTDELQAVGDDYQLTAAQVRTALDYELALAA